MDTGILLGPAWNVGKKIFAFLKKPSLEIYYDPDETYHLRRDLLFNGHLCYFVHVMVKNTGRSIARNCSGKLKSIEVLQNNKFQRVYEYTNVMTLKWAHENDFLPKDIDTDLPKRLDVCFVHKNRDILCFFTEKYPSGNQTDFLPNTYRITVKVVSDNTKSVEKKFIVKLDNGNFQSLNIQNT